MEIKDESMYSHRIEELLCRNRWSLYRLSKESGVPYSTLSNMVHRGTAPTARTLKKICRAFCVSTEELIGSPEEGANDFVCTAEERRLVKKFRKLSDEDRKMVNRLVGKL